KPFLPPDMVRSRKGIIDLIKRYEDEARMTPKQLAQRAVPRPAEWERAYARIQDLVLPIAWKFPDQGALDYLSSGLQNEGYSSALSGLDWNTFYERLGGKEFFRVLREEMQQQYDYVLIDSRTGLNDVQQICTQRLPDVLIACFTLSDQGIEGTADVAAQAHEQVQLRQPIRVLPVRMRVDQAEKEKVDVGRALARHSFADFPTGMSPAERDRYWGTVEVPYRAFYAYEETLATFGDEPGMTGSLLSAYEMLSSVITEGEVTTFPALDEQMRKRVKEQYRRRIATLASEIVLEFAATDQAWAEWAQRVLSAVDVRVADLRPLEIDLQTQVADPDGALDGMTTREHQLLTIVSPALTQHLAEAGGLPGASTPRLGVQISPGRPPQLRFQGSVNLASFDVDQADESVERLLRLVGRGGAETVDQVRRTAPYPRRDPRRSNLFPRNTDFTGRADVIWNLRRTFREGHSIVALSGLGGVGKTQLANEYAHRFRSSYELIWWINADNPRAVEGALADLADAVGIPAQAEREKTMTSTLDSLRRGEPTRDWLIVLDNAEEPASLARLLAKQLPGTPGHVLVTTRSQDWEGERFAAGIQVPVFHRVESTSRLRNQVTDLTSKEADELAEALGDLPLAVDAAIGSLRTADVDVRNYLRALTESSTPRGAGADQKLMLTLGRTFGVSLERLREQSPAAHRLLQIFSVMAPVISTEFIFGETMAEALMPFDPSVTDRTMRQPLLRTLERFSLVTQDTRNRSVQVHRLLQDFVRERMTDEERATTRHQVHLILARSRPGPEVDTPNLWPAFRRLWPHLPPSEAGRCLDHDVRELLVDRVRYLWLRGVWSQGEQVATDIARFWESLLDGSQAAGETSDLEPQLLWLRHNLANIWRDQAEFERAFDIDQRTLARLIELLGPNHTQTLRSAASYAADLRALGQYDEALDRERETTRRWTQYFGERFPLALQGARNLAVSLRAVGKFAEARAIDEQLLERLVAEFGPDDPRYLATADALGRDLREAGEYQASVDWLTGVLATYHKANERSVKGALTAQANLAASWRSAGRPDRASPLLDDAYNQLKEFFGPDRPDTLACRLNRAINLLVENRLQDSLCELEATVTAYERILGTRHPLTLTSRSNLSAAMLVDGQLDQARNLAHAAWEGCQESVGVRHPYTQAAAMNLAVCLNRQGQSQEAAEHLSRAADVLVEEFGREHPDALLARISVTLLRSPDDAWDRMPKFSPDLDRLADRIGKDHPTIRDLTMGKLVTRLIDPSDPF
ncbi:MAG: hypothetical protein QG597_1637, partial [Actinomycetota bacterium]|nr:hypothetical protein [Actinomycetota bacterium]